MYVKTYFIPLVMEWFKKYVYSKLKRLKTLLKRQPWNINEHP